MAETIGKLAEVGFGLEATEGTGVQLQALLESTSASLQGRDNKIFSQSLRGHLPRKAVVGSAFAEGSIVCEATPEKFSRVIYAFCGDDTTTGVADPFTHTMKPAQGVPKPCTWMRRIGGENYWLVYGGSMIGRLEFALATEALLIVTPDVMAQWEAVYTSDPKAAGAGYDTNDPFTFAKARLELPDGTPFDDADDIRITLTRGPIRKQTIRNTRFPHKHIGGPLEGEVRVRHWFSTDTERKKFMSTTTAAPYKSGTAIQKVKADLLCTSATNRTLQILLDMVYTNWDDPLPGPEAIMQEATARVIIDGASEPQIIVVNSENNAAVTGTGTALASQPT